MKTIKIFLIVLLLPLSGCATVAVVNMDDEGFSVEEDERRLASRADEQSELLTDSGFVYNDREVESYMNNIAQKLLATQFPHGDKPDITIVLLKNPALNAFALGNGHIYIHTGIFSSATTEAQMAALIAHEMTHIVNRHILKQFRSIKNKSAFIATVAPLGLPGLLAQLGGISSIAGFSQHLEYEADEGGYNMLFKSHYDVRESVKLFESLEKYIDDEEIKQPYFFSSHPHVKNRISNFKQLAAKQKMAEDAVINTAAYSKLWKKVAMDNMRYCLDQGFFKTAANLIDVYLKRYEEVEGQYLKGEIYRKRQDRPKSQRKTSRDKTEDYQIAMNAYHKVIAQDASFALAYRGLAMVLQKLNQKEAALKNFETYLSKAPSADDQAYIRQTIEMIKNENNKE